MASIELTYSRPRQKQLNDLTECTICQRVYTDPRLLPCKHTYCLRCIDQYAKGAIPGNSLLCPQCRHPFIIPQGGVAGLPNNSFTTCLIQLKRGETLLPCKAEVDHGLVLFFQYVSIA